MSWSRVDAEADASAPAISREEHEAREVAMGYRETIEAVSPVAEPAPAGEVSVDDVREILENGVREIAGEVRNSLDFHRTQDAGRRSRPRRAQRCGARPARLRRGAAVDARDRSSQRGRRPRRRRARGHGLDAQAVRCGRTGDDRGAAMRAVNLIPSDDRRGGAAGRRRALGWRRLCGARRARRTRRARIALRHGAPPDLEPQRSKLASVQARTQRAQETAAGLAPYTSFMSLREQRVQAVADLVDSRFDWAHVASTNSAACCRVKRRSPRSPARSARPPRPAAARAVEPATGAAGALGRALRRRPAASRRSRSRVAQRARRRSRDDAAAPAPDRRRQRT